MADEKSPTPIPVETNTNTPVELLLSLKQANRHAAASETNHEPLGTIADASTDTSSLKVDDHREASQSSPTGSDHVTARGRDNTSSTASTSSGSETDLPSSSSESASKSNGNDEEYVPPSSRPVNTNTTKRAAGTASKPVGRNNLPKDVTAKLKAWFFDHADHPYPNEEKKLLLAQECDLTIMQINNWFINARRRLINRPPKRAAGEAVSTTASVTTTSSHAIVASQPNRLTRVKASHPNSHDSNTSSNPKTSSDEDVTLNAADSSEGSDKASSHPSSNHSTLAAAAVPQLMAQVNALKDQVQQQQLQLLQQHAVIQAMKTQQALMPTAMMMPNDMTSMYSTPMMGNYRPPTSFGGQNADTLSALMSLQQRMGAGQSLGPPTGLGQPTTLPSTFASPFNLAGTSSGYDITRQSLTGLSNTDWQAQTGFQGPFSGQPLGKRAKTTGSSNASSSGGSTM
eukprot:m.162494 g.162494  ORF g.162494 m.162494 type:complete len:457 (-) comp16534_c0_seq1:2939-4309(-)